MKFNNFLRQNFKESESGKDYLGNKLKIKNILTICLILSEKRKGCKRLTF